MMIVVLTGSRGQRIQQLNRRRRRGIPLRSILQWNAASGAEAIPLQVHIAAGMACMTLLGLGDCAHRFASVNLQCHLLNRLHRGSHLLPAGLRQSHLRPQPPNQLLHCKVLRRLRLAPSHWRILGMLFQIHFVNPLLRLGGVHFSRKPPSAARKLDSAFSFGRRGVAHRRPIAPGSQRIQHIAVFERSRALQDHRRMHLPIGANDETYRNFVTQAGRGD